MKSKSLVTIKQMATTLGLSAVISAFSAGAVAATPQTWNFGYDAGGNGNYTSADRRYVGSNGLGVTISGWYGSDVGGSSLENADWALRHWSGGLGMQRNEEHTVDNKGYDELVAFVFDQAVSLTGVKFGWYENDSDATILYQTNKTQGFSGLGSTSISNLTSNGYSLLGNLYNPETAAQTVQGTTSSSFDGPTQAGPVYSKVWLVGAYLRGVTGNSDTYAGAWDSIKIKTLIAHTANAVPLPATAALLALGLLLMRRRTSLAG